MLRLFPLFLSLLICLLIPNRPAPAAEQGMRWEKNYAAAMAQCKKQRKPLLIEFYADWCGPCKKMDETTFKDPEVLKVTRKFVALKLNMDKAREIARKFNVTSTPHALILWPNGKVSREAVGYQEAPIFRLFLLQGLPG